MGDADAHYLDLGDVTASFDDAYVPPPEPPGEDRGAGQDMRPVPRNQDAEVGVLGGLILDPDRIPDVVDMLRSEDFFYPQHQIIFKTLIDLFADSSAVDAFILSDRLKKYGNYERVGGAGYISELVHRVPTAANVRYYARIVAEQATLRRLVEAGTRVVQLGYEATEDAEVEQVVDQAQQEVFAVARNTKRNDYSSVSELLDPVLREIEEIGNHGGLEMGVPTGFRDLDELTNGLRGGQMIIVAARPGVGKSTLAMDFVRSCSIRNNKTSLVFSLEMSKSEIMMRLLSAEAEVKLSDMRSGRVVDDEHKREWLDLVDCTGRIENAPLYIDDSPNLTMMEIRSKSRRLAQQTGELSLIVVDYLQLMSSGKRVESRQQEVAEFSRQLKLLAKELDVPVVAISQLNRGPEARTDKKPQIADLRESGSLEQDADMVFLLYRPDSQDTASERAGEADIIVAKHRGGPIGTVPVAHQLQYSRFGNLAGHVGGM